MSLSLRSQKIYLPEIDGGEASLVIVVNKIDLVEFARSLEEFEHAVGGRHTVVRVSVVNDVSLHCLKEVIFQALGMVRLYSKLPGKKPDMKVPFILDRGSTVADAATKIHRHFREKLRYAKLWQEGVYDGIMVSRGVVLQDKDIIELHV